MYARKSLDCHEQNVGINVDVKGHAGETSDRNEEQVIRNWRKDGSCYKVVKNLVELCSSILWKVELASHEIEYLAEEISKQSVEGAVWFLLTALVKCERREMN